MMWTLSIPDFPWLFGKKRRLYNQSRTDFYEGRNSLTTHTSLNAILNFNQLDSLSTSKPIQFYGLQFGQSYKETIKKLGKPNFVDKRRLAVKQQKTIFYRLTIKEVKCILQIHFFQDQFFYGKMELRGSNPTAKRDIGLLVCQKYGITEENWTGSILDPSGNLILIKENIVPNICYITGNKQIVQALRNELNILEGFKKHKQVGQSEILLDMV